ncbi:MAG: nicotinate (nicotinamide) nucleotide adenylyltransferase [Phycisphaerae bacterium]
MGKTILFGGTFDPVHRGHIETARAAVEALGADICRFIPARVSPHKRNVKSVAAEDRVAMLRLATAGDPRLVVEEVELRLAAPNYTIHTVETLQHAYPGERLVWLLGADQLGKFAQWHRIDELLGLVEFALLARPGVDLEAGLATVEAGLGQRVAAQLRGSVVPAPLVDISATEIRRRCAAGEGIGEFVVPAVAEYILTHGLYR